jgi:hypothetical protein
LLGFQQKVFYLYTLAIAPWVFIAPNTIESAFAASSFFRQRHPRHIACNLAVNGGIYLQAVFVQVIIIILAPFLQPFFHRLAQVAIPGRFIIYITQVEAQRFAFTLAS